jgi:hypothetical protein
MANSIDSILVQLQDEVRLLREDQAADRELLRQIREEQIALKVKIKRLREKQHSGLIDLVSSSC